MDPRIIAAALFLPLFPFSILFNCLFEVLRNSLLRGLILLIWPQLGVLLLQEVDSTIPSWLVSLGLATSLLYGFRALVLRELTHWISFLAVSTWSLLWLVGGFVEGVELHLLALGISIPLGVLTLLGSCLEKRFGASYAGLYNGLGYTMPRFSGVFVFTVLAVIATPTFPGFTAVAVCFIEITKSSLLGSITLCLIWLTWCWSGARLIQGFVIGREGQKGIEDISSGLTWAYVVVLVSLVAFGIYTLGILS